VKNLRHLIEEMQGDDGLVLTRRHHAYKHGDYEDEGEYGPVLIDDPLLLGPGYQHLGNGGYRKRRQLNAE
jgi:hypothetical protein